MPLPFHVFANVGSIIFLSLIMPFHFFRLAKNANQLFLNCKKCPHTSIFGDLSGGYSANYTWFVHKRLKKHKVYNQ